MYLSLMTATPLFVVICLAVSAKIVLWRRITNSTTALLYGLGVVPVVVGGCTFTVSYLVYPTDPEFPLLAGVVSITGGMIGGWIGASVAYLKNQTSSDQPEVQRAYRENMEQAKGQPRRNTISERLQAVGLVNTSGNCNYYLLGAFFVLLCFMGVMYKMISLGFTTPSQLLHLPHVLRLFGCVAPFVVPSTVYIFVRRWLPALAFGLRDASIPLVIAYAPVYAVLNMLASPPAR